MSAVVSPAAESAARFRAQLRQGVTLSFAEDEVIRVADVRNSEHLQALLWNFPSLSKLVDFPKLSNAAMRVRQQRRAMFQQATRVKQLAADARKRGGGQQI